MVLLFLVLTLLFFLFINYYISDRDIFNPAFIFTAMNAVSAVICLAAKDMYDIVFHMNTYGVLVLGVFVFTFFNFVCRGKSRLVLRAGGKAECEPEVICINAIWILLFIVFELLVSYLLYDYVRRVATAHSGSNNFLVQIGVYNNLTKFNTEALQKLGVSQSPISAFGYPLCIAFCFFLIAVDVNNFFLTKKVEKLHLCAIGLLMVMSLITGSRSFVFTIITAIVCDFVIIRRKITGKYFRASPKIIFRISVVSIILIFAFSSMITMMGRTVQGGFKTFFTYLGASFLNLDTFLQEEISRSALWGQETFANFYSFLGDKLNKPEWIYTLKLPFRYRNGMSVGNVYTMYYQFIKDFGYMAVLPLTAIAAWFYSHHYKVLAKSKKIPTVSFRLIVFSMLYNDLIMLTFSNRFYESLLRTRSIRFYIWLSIIWICYQKGLFTVKTKLSR